MAGVHSAQRWFREAASIEAASGPALLTEAASVAYAVSRF